MSREVDERVVKLEFNNKEFEKKASSTISILDKLNEKLSFKNISKTASNLANSLNLSSISDAVSGISGKFTNLGIMGVTALQNITNQAIETGKRVASAFTIDPIKTGFSEYETQINAVQTILANTQSKGTTLDQVNKALDELNTYADKTIYNFTEMTKNIGTFTAAGVDLDTSVAAIKGIANLAAMSGSNAQQAASGMYQLSQALASGSLRLQDWNSVNTAGLGGETFQEELKRTARVHGIEVDKMIEKNGTFRESLKEGWITSEILTETLAKYTGDLSREQLLNKGYTSEQTEEILKLGQTANDSATKVKTFTQLFDTLQETAQSGWTQSWEIIIGDFEEAKGLLTTLSDKIGALLDSSSAARIKLLQQWKDMGGRKVLIDALNQSFKTTSSLIKPLSKGFRNVFPEKTAKQLVNMTKKFRDFIKNLKLSKERTAQFTNAFSGLFSLVKMGIDLFKELAIGVKGFIVDTGISNTIIKLVGNFGAMLSSIRSVIEETKFFKKIINSVLVPLKQAFIAAFPEKTVTNFNKLRAAITGLIKGFQPSVKTTENLRRTFSGLFGIIKIGISFVKGIWHEFSKLFSKISENVNGGGILEFTASIGDSINEFNKYLESVGGFAGLFDDAITKIKEAFEKAKNAIDDFIKKVKEFFKIDPNQAKKFSDTTAKSMDNLKNVMDHITAAFEKVKEVYGKVWAFLQPIFERIGQFFGKIFNAIKDNIQGLTITDLFKLLQSGALTALILQLKKTIKSFTKDFKGIGSSVKSLLSGVGETLKGFTEILKAEALMKIAKAVAVLAASLLVMSLLDTTKLTVATLAVSVMFQQIARVFKSFSKISNVVPIEVGILSDAFYRIAKAIGVMAVAMAILSKLDPLQMVTAALAIVFMLKGISSLLKEFNEIITSLNGVSFTEFYVIIDAFKQISKAILILAVAIKIIGKMPIENIAAAAIALIAILSSIAKLMDMMGDFKINLTAIKAIETISKTIGKFALVVAVLGLMSWDNLLKGLGAFVTILAGIGIFMKAANKIKMFGKIGENILSLAKGMMYLTAAIFVLSKINIWDLAKALGAIAISVAIFGAALRLIKIEDHETADSIVKMAKAILIFAPAMFILSKIGWTGLAIGIAAIASAFIVMGLAAKALEKKYKIIESLSKSMSRLGIGIAAVGAGILMMSAAIVLFSGASAAAIGSIYLIASTILSLIPLLFQKLGEGMVAFIQAIVDSGDAIIKGLVTVIESALVGLNDLVPDFVDLLVTIIDETLTALAEHTYDWTDKLLVIILDALKALAERIPEIVEVGVKLLADTFLAIGEALQNYAPEQLKSILLGIGIIAAIFIAVQKLSGDIKKALPPLIMMIVLLAAVVGAFYIVSLINTETVQVIADSLSSCLVSLAAALKIVSTIPVAGAISGLISLAIFLGGLVAILAILGGLNQIPGFSWLLEEGSKVLEQIGGALGGFVGSLVGNFLGNMSNAFPTIGENLSKFFKNVQPFIKGVSNVNGDKLLGGCTAIAAAIIELTAAELLDSLVGWLTGKGSLEDFGNQLAAFAPPIKKFYDGLNGVDADRLYVAASAIKALADVGQSIKEGGLAGFFSGTTDWTKFGEGIGALGPALVAFNASLVDSNGKEILNLKAIKNAASAAIDIADIGSHIKDGGVADFFAGTTDWELFGTGMTEVATGLVDFNDKITDSNGKSKLNESAISSAVSAAKNIADIGGSIKDGGIADFFAGTTDWEQFGKGMKQTGFGLSRFAYYVSGLDEGQLDVGIEALTSIVDLANQIPESGGVGQLFGGDKSIDVWGTKLASFGQYVADYGDNISAVDTSKFAAVTAQIIPLVRISRELSTMGEKGDALFSFASNMHNIAGSGFDNFIKGINGAKEGLTQSVLSAFSIVTRGLKNGDSEDKEDYWEYKHIGATAIGKFNKGIKSKEKATKNAVKKIFESITKTVKSISNYYDIGSGAIQGFINGMNSEKQNAIATARIIAASALDGTAEELDINSPSKEFGLLGKYSVIGFANGLLNYSNAVKNAGVSVGSEALNAVKNSISSISGIVNDNMDTNPVITPVLDLSEIQNGSKQIDNMIGYGYGYSTLNASLNGIYSKYSKRNNPNKDITDSINNLSEKLDNVENAILNMGIYLNDDTIVGKITPKINKKLGRQIQFAKRGM